MIQVINRLVTVTGCDIFILSFVGKKTKAVPFQPEHANRTGGNIYFPTSLISTLKQARN